MFKGYKATDADGHVMEPVDLWDNPDRLYHITG